MGLLGALAGTVIFTTVEFFRLALEVQNFEFSLD